MRTGTCRFGLWFVHVSWERDVVHRVRFLKTGEEAPVPLWFLLYLSGRTREIDLQSIATAGPSTYARIYREVVRIPYGSTATYGEIADKAGTAPRVVGMAMARNPTPLVIPCHRVVARDSLGGFTPSLELKTALLELENSHRE